MATIRMNKFIVKNLDCAGCAMKIESGIRNLEGVTDASINFATKKLYLQTDFDIDDEFIAEANKLISDIEPDAVLQSEIEVKAEEPEKYGFKIAKLVIPIILFLVSFGIKDIYLKDGFLIIAYIIAGYNVVLQSFKNIVNGEIFDENFLMTVASIGAILIGDLGEGVGVMIFYSIGEFMQDLAVNKSRRSISDLMDIRPEFANVLVDDKVVIMDPNEVKIGDHILIKPGERVPVDGRVIEGESMIDTSALTGESVPRKVYPNYELLSGAVNLNALLKLEVTKAYEDSAVARILELVEDSGAKKAPTEKFITRFAKYYTPVVVIGALFLAFIPPFITGDAFSTWIYRALVFLVASCPCALVVSIPLGFFAGIGRASKDGILVKGGNYLEAINKIDRIVFDKTGTLTYGEFKVTELFPEDGISEDELLETAWTAEYYSDHPIADSIKRAYDGNESPVNYSITDIGGQGIKAEQDDTVILAGNEKLMESNNIDFRRIDESGTIIYVAKNSKFYGSILISDEIKSEAKDAINSLREMGIKFITMLTGDNEQIGKEVAHKIGIDDVKTNLLPQDKVKYVEDMLTDDDKSSLAFVGDGINDAPVLMLSDIGIAMGQIGTDAAIEAADVVIMEDNLSKISTLVKISRKTMRIIFQNIFMALAFKIIVLFLGATGHATMWFAVFADTGVTLLAILNSIRILKK
ncbi:MAG: heavy metal translocating P-type ATPase [Tissierellia bacterium]|nr:heavy metal translocating P-type ATPase [Tissierellia bacterium]